MSSTSSRHGLAKLFHRRDGSTATNESNTTQAPSNHQPAAESSTRRREGTRRSFGDFVRSRSRSLSRPRGPGRRNVSVERPSTAHSPVVRRTHNRDSEAPQRPERTDLQTDQDVHLLQALGPNVPPRASSLHRRQGSKGGQNSNSNVVSIGSMMLSAEDPYSEKVADWNIAHGVQPLTDDSPDYPSPLKVTKATQFSESPESQDLRYNPPGPLAHKPDVENLRRSVDTPRAQGKLPQREATYSEHHQQRRRMSRSSLNKPLPGVPPIPQQHAHKQSEYQQPHQHASGDDNELGRKKGYLVRDSKDPIDLTGVVNLENTEETHEHVNWAPAVTHETRKVDTHEIVQKAITREIHNYHIHHRILPVIDIEVLPARHFVEAEGGGYREISAAEVPGGTNTAQLEQLVHEAVQKMLPKRSESTGSRQFTARSFHGTEGDHKEYTAPEGFRRTEQWWVHPPTVETGGQETGQTVPFHFGSEDPKDDGLRLPEKSGSEGVRRIKTTMPSQLPASTHTVLPIRMRHGEGGEA